MKREAKQMNTMPKDAGTKAASTSAPSNKQFVGSNPTKNTKGPQVMSNPLVGPEGAAYMVRSPAQSPK